MITNLSHKQNNKSSLRIDGLTLATDQVNISSQDLSGPNKDHVRPVAFPAKTRKRVCWNFSTPSSTLDILTGELEDILD